MPNVNAIYQTPEFYAASVAEDQRIEEEARHAEQQEIERMFNALEAARNQMEAAISAFEKISSGAIAPMVFDDMVTIRAGVAERVTTLGNYFSSEIKMRY